MRFEVRFDIFAVFMLIGLSQGIILSYFFLMKKHRKELSTLFFGLFILVLNILLSEIFLNYTGFIVKIIRIENYSEAFIFLLMPLLFLIIKTKLNEGYTIEDHVHFFPFIFYFIYCILYFLQSPEFKYNSYVYCFQPGWDYLEVKMRIPEDPLHLRSSLPALYLSQAIVYLYLIIIKLKYYPSEIKFGFFRKKDKVIKPLFGHWIQAFIAFILILYIKIHFEGDMGDFIIGSYISIILYVTGFVVLTRQLSFTPQDSGNYSSKPKYEKSSLTEEKKIEIIGKLSKLLDEKKYYVRNTVSLSDTAKAIGESPHHVSQAINEKLGKSFFDLLSRYRIEEARRLLLDESTLNLTIEEIAEQVGYNSKAAFNKAFKNLSGKTPSEYRNQRNQNSKET